MKISESEKIIRTLYEITCKHNEGFESQVTKLLKLGCERFNLDIGILSKINGNNYEVVFNVTPSKIKIPNGSKFDLNRTFCSLVIKANGPVGYEHVKNSDINNHPAYLDQKLESYIGAPVYVDDEIYGTFNFSSPTPRPRAFQPVDIDALQLMAAWLGSEISRNQKEAQLKEANKQLQEFAIKDCLTKLYNRRHFETEFSKLMSLAKRQKQCSSIILLDVDRFKKINDNFGHAAGDDVLIEIAQILLKQTRRSDLIARYGGEEFIIFLPDTDKTGAECVTETIRKSIESHEWTNVQVTASFGIQTIDQNKIEILDIDDIMPDAISSADKALYFAKMNGRNQSIHYQNLGK